MVDYKVPAPQLLSVTSASVTAPVTLVTTLVTLDVMPIPAIFLLSS